LAWRQLDVPAVEQVYPITSDGTRIIGTQQMDYSLYESDDGEAWSGLINHVHLVAISETGMLLTTDDFSAAGAAPRFYIGRP